MSKRGLILYYTMTGNTTKVVKRFEQVFQERGWECDTVKITSKTNVRMHPSPFDCDKYDLICVGSGTYKSLPGEQVIDIMRGNPRSIHYDPKIATGEALPGEGGPPPEGEMPEQPPANMGPPPTGGHRKTELGPDNQKGIVFATYAGHDFGPPEVVPCIETLALEMAHLEVVCIGKFSCPGKFGRGNKNVFHKDIDNRPDERDLMRAELFMHDILDRFD